MFKASNLPANLNGMSCFFFSSASWMWNRAPVLNRVLSTGELYCVVLYEYIRDWGCWYFLILGFVSATANNNINIWLIYIRLPSEWHIAETIRKIEGSSSLLHERIFFFSNKKRCLSQAHFILRIFLLLWIEAGLKRVMGIKLRRCIQNMNEKKKSVSIDWRYDWSSHHDGINHSGDSLAFQDKKLQRFFLTWMRGFAENKNILFVCVGKNEQKRNAKWAYFWLRACVCVLGFALW